MFRRRCGKASCRCVDGEPHESPALIFTEDGKTKTVTLSPAEVPEVTAALARYEAMRAEMDTAAAAGLARFRQQRTSARARR